MTAASVALQRALFAALSTNSGLAVLTGLYDAVPIEAQPPYATLGPDVVTDWSSKTGVGREHRVQLTVWDFGPGSTRTKALLGSIEAAVATLPSALDGHCIANIFFLRSLVTKNPDGWTQGIAEFRIRTEQL